VGSWESHLVEIRMGGREGWEGEGGFGRISEVESGLTFHRHCAAEDEHRPKKINHKLPASAVLNKTLRLLIVLLGMSKSLQLGSDRTASCLSPVARWTR